MAPNEKFGGLHEAQSRLDLGRRARLTAGANAWSTHSEPGIGLHPMLLGDGPMGLVSVRFDERDTASLLPGGIALAASWDPNIVRAVALVQGSEALRRGYSAVYAPNLNLARTGLSGRTFEMYGEDPYLAGILGATFVRGMQSQGVAACPKHLVCNDTETERQRMNVKVDETALREVYLRPFELALGAGAKMVMAAYNRVNGVPATEQADIFRILRNDWGWDGVIVSDYFALRDTARPMNAGLNLEMPGPAIYFGARLAEAVAAEHVSEDMVDESVRRILHVAQWAGSLDGNQRSVSAPADHIEESDAHDTLVAAAAASFTLTKNSNGLLPLRPKGRPRLAVVGLNATRPTFQGATFGLVRPSRDIDTPLRAIEERLADDYDIAYEPGVPISALEPLSRLTGRTPDGRPGVLLEHFRGDEQQPCHTEVRLNSMFVWFGEVPDVGPTTDDGRIRLTTVLRAEQSGRYTVGVGGTGAATISVDGHELAAWPAPAPEDVMGQVARAEMATAGVDLDAGSEFTLVAEMRRTGGRVQALSVGVLEPQDPEEVALRRAVDAAAAADVVVVIAGDELTTSRESRDLPTGSLPESQERLVQAVLATGTPAAVILNAGRPVTTDWADDADAVMFAWLPGQGFADALAQVLAGDLEPAGRLPVTIPYKDADRATYAEQLDNELSLDYTATEPTGYRHLQRTATSPRFAFGFGLGYTTWAHDDVGIVSDRDGHAVEVTVRNTGQRAGREVVQVYAQAPGERDFRLAAFAGLHLSAGSAERVHITLDGTAFRRWDAARHMWSTPAGTHRLHVGRSSGDISAVLEITIAEREIDAAASNAG